MIWYYEVFNIIYNVYFLPPNPFQRFCDCAVKTRPFESDTRTHTHGTHTQSCIFSIIAHYGSYCMEAFFIILLFFSTSQFTGYLSSFYSTDVLSFALIGFILNAIFSLELHCSSKLRSKEDSSFDSCHLDFCETFRDLCFKKVIK